MSRRACAPCPCPAHACPVRLLPACRVRSLKVQDSLTRITSACLNDVVHYGHPSPLMNKIMPPPSDFMGRDKETEEAVRLFAPAGAGWGQGARDLGSRSWVGV